jgi:ATP-binding protein involved in chromosome partitioning
VPLLAELPLEMLVREGGDRGQPVVLAQPATATARAFMALAERIRSSLLQPA